MEPDNEVLVDWDEASASSVSFEPITSRSSLLRELTALQKDRGQEQLDAEIRKRVALERAKQDRASRKTTKSDRAKGDEALAAVNRGCRNISGSTLRLMIPSNATLPEPEDQNLGDRSVREAAALASAALRRAVTDDSMVVESDKDAVYDEGAGDGHEVMSELHGKEGDVVQRFLSEEWKKVILDAVNSHTSEQDVKVGGKRARDQYPAFTLAEFDAITRMLSERINPINSLQTFKQYLRSKERAGYYRKADGTVGFITEERFRKFAEHLDFDVDAAFSSLCSAFRKNICFYPLAEWIRLACDEGMIVYRSPEHRWVVYIPRKPEPWGMRVYIIATVLAHTGRPIVVDIIPDMKNSGEFMNGREVMAEAGRRIQALMQEGVIPKKASLTMDALFSYADQLKRWLGSNIYGTLSMRTDSTLLAALGHGLKPGYHRLFNEGNIVMTVYRDVAGKNWFGNFSTCFRVKNPRSLSSYPLTERPARVPPTYQMPFIWFLVHMASVEKFKNDLRMMATFHGMSVTAALQAKPLEMVAYITRKSVDSLRVLANQAPPAGPVQDIVARMHSVAHLRDTSGEAASVEQEMAILIPAVPFTQMERPKMSDEEKALHRKALKTFSKYEIETTSRQRTVNTKQLKQFAAALDQTLDPKQSREESLAWLMEVEDRRSHGTTIEEEETSERMEGSDGIISDASTKSAEKSHDASTSEDSPPTVDEQLEGVVVENASLAAVKRDYPTKSEIVEAIRSLTRNCSVSGDILKLQVKYARILKKMYKCPQFALRILNEFEARGKADTVQFYSDTFNYVDRIDLMMAYLSFDGYFRRDNAHMVILSYMIRLATVQAHSCVCTVVAAWNWDEWDWNKYRLNTENFRENVFKDERAPIKPFWNDVRSAWLSAENGLREEYVAQCYQEKCKAQSVSTKRRRKI